MSALQESCREYLASKRTTLWGRAFDVNDEAGLDAAAEWFAEQVRGVLEVRQQQEETVTEEFLRLQHDSQGFTVNGGYRHLPEPLRRKAVSA